MSWLLQKISYDLFLGLFISFLTYLIGLLQNKIMIYYKYKCIRLFYTNKLVINKYDIILSARQGNKVGSTPKGSFLEMEAFHAIGKLLNILKIEINLKNGLKEERLVDIENDLLLIGGPSYNKVSKDVWNKICEISPVTLDMEGNNTIKVGIKNYSISFDEQTSKMKTYAIIFKVHNPIQNKKDKCIIASFGLNGFGTMGGVSVLSDREKMIKIFQNYSDEFIAIVESEFEHNKLIKSRILYLTNFNNHERVASVD